MKLPLSWLKQYVDIELDPRELGHRMTLAGVEAESVEVIGGAWEGIVVGCVTAVAPHPNADRLRLATVDTGAESITVVCGAPNVAEGQRIAFARAGARLIDGHTGQPTILKPARIRGVESRGMVCSERELGLSDEHEGILVLPDDAPVGAPLADCLGDAIFDFAVTPNRPDCLSVLGIAREVAALTGQRVREPALEYPEAGPPIPGLARVDILDPDLCPRYIATVVSGVKIGPSPRWMQDRLTKAGMRPINNVVDITNYVMLEYGQPLHAFDYDRLAEHRIVVRRARAGEAIVTIDGQRRELSPETLVVADAARAMALAGVMGGAESEVSDRTVSVLLESANFNNVSIRRTARETGLRSEASLRFEKGLSPELPLRAARRATQLLVETAGGNAAQGIIDVYPGEQARQPLRLTERRTRLVLGVGVSAGEMSETLERLGFVCQTAGEGAVDISVPYWRTDIAIEDDLIEEIVRVKGYDWIPSSVTVGGLPPFEPEPMLALKEAVRDFLTGVGMDEVITYPLVGADTLPAGSAALRVANPLAADLAALRLDLRQGLLRTLATNQRLQERAVRIFETGRIFLPRAEDLPEEREMVAGLLCGPRHEPHWEVHQGDLDFFDAKGMTDGLLGALGIAATYAPAQDPLLHPGRSARVSVGGTAIGVAGELHPRALKAHDLREQPVAYFELDLQALLPLLAGQGRLYRAIPRFPGVLRDLALVVDTAVPAHRVTEIIVATPLVRDATLFDVYTGGQVPPGKKSLAYRIVYLSPSRTLSNEEADQAQAGLLERLAEEVGATLRA